MCNVVPVFDMVGGFLEPDHNLYCGDEAGELNQSPNCRLKDGTL